MQYVKRLDVKIIIGFFTYNKIKLLKPAILYLRACKPGYTYMHKFSVSEKNMHTIKVPKTL